MVGQIIRRWISEMPVCAGMQWRWSCCQRLSSEDKRRRGRKSVVHSKASEAAETVRGG
ncbi:hypothetical protein JB92DRAFT_2927894 [Gautieria morchelliformis]|nr:hypothetical protein JB92DRAFT_3015042 [Gautieria morchelliformis]KAF8512588.1 hypothetical protein JB92DRAFT_2927894 [Gautieria morchelliformis]